MIVKSRLKLERQVLFEKKSKNPRSAVDIFKELTDGCKITYDPKFKSRLFLVKGNNTLLSVMAHGFNKKIVLYDCILDSVASRFYGVHPIRIKRQFYRYYVRTEDGGAISVDCRKEVFHAIQKFVKQYGYHVNWSWQISEKVGQVKYLIKNDEVILRAGDLWFTTN